MDMEYCPSRLPFKACSRLLGGTLRSFKVFAKSMYSRRLTALLIKSDGRRLDLPETKIRCVSLSAKVLIMLKIVMRHVTVVKVTARDAHHPWESCLGLSPRARGNHIGELEVPSCDLKLSASSSSCASEITDCYLKR